MSPFLGTRGAGTNKGFGFAAASRPNQVTGLTATDFGTNRAFNDARIDLSWSAPANNGANITGYFIERSTDGSNYSTLVANTGSSATTYSNTGLSSAQIYYYRVSAINSVGTGLASTAANATATTIPQAPTIGTATASGLSASITYTANATGGKAVSVYTAISSPGSITGTGASPITVSGLTGGTAYTFTITATNANGTSAASAASNSVTPVAYFMTTIDSGTTNDAGMAVHSDSSGNVYIGGRIQISTTWYGYFAKFNSAGTVQWQKTIYATNDSANTIASIGTDSSGNVYALGNYRAPSNTQTILIKTDSSGNTVWKKNYGAVYSDAPGNMIVTSAGTCYFVDHSAETGNGEFLLAIVDTNGNLSYSKRVNFGIVVGSQAEIGTVNLAVDSSGNMYPQTKQYVAKVNSNQTVAWGRVMQTGGGSVNMGKPSVDSSGNVYACTPWSSSNSTVITKIDSNGTKVWDKYLAATNNTIPAASGTAMDSSNNLYVLFRNLSTGTTMYIRKYDSNANLIWTRVLTASTGNIDSTQVDPIKIIGDIIYIAGRANNNLFLAKLPIDGSKTGTYTVGSINITYATDTGTTNSSPGNPISNKSTSLANPTNVPFTTDTEVTVAGASLTIATTLI